MNKHKLFEGLGAGLAGLEAYVCVSTIAMTQFIRKLAPLSQALILSAVAITVSLTIVFLWESIIFNLEVK